MHDLQIKTKQLKDTDYYISVTILSTEKTMMKKVLTLMALVLCES